MNMFPDGFKVDLDQLVQPETSFRMQRSMDRELLHQLFTAAGCSPSEIYDGLVAFDKVTEETLRELPDAKTYLELIQHANRADCATNPRKDTRLDLPNLDWIKS